MNEIIQNDNGTLFDITIQDDNGIVDIRGATVEVAIKYKNRKVVKIATITDGINGKCEVSLSRDDVSDEGVYSLQSTVKFGDGKEFSSDLHRFTVSKKI